MISARIPIKDLADAKQLWMMVPVAKKKALMAVAEEIRTDLIAHTPVGRTGRLKGGWSPVQEMVTGRSLVVENPIEYAYILEEGLYKNVGPRTVAIGAGIYSTQAPGGIVGPLLEDDLSFEKFAELFIAKYREAMG